MLQSMGLPRVGYGLTTEPQKCLQQTPLTLPAHHSQDAQGGISKAALWVAWCEQPVENQNVDSLSRALRLEVFRQRFGNTSEGRWQETT